jgi:hypothetical protein
MTIDELIEELRKIQDEHGNISVCILDSDTRWLLEIESVDAMSEGERLFVSLFGGYQ